MFDTSWAEDIEVPSSLPDKTALAQLGAHSECNTQQRQVYLDNIRLIIAH